MKTIKIIDLFNKIAKGEEVPKKIEYKGVIRTYNDEDKDYISPQLGPQYGEFYLFHDVLHEGTGEKMVKALNDKVQVIEEVEEDEFEDIEKTKSYEDFEGIDDYIEHLKSKINELIKNQKKIIEQLKNKD